MTQRIEQGTALTSITLNNADYLFVGDASTLIAGNPETCTTTVGDIKSFILADTMNAIPNKIVIDPDASADVAGKIYQTYSDAVSYINTSGSPSASNPWVIELPAGTLGASVLGSTMEIYDYINIMGQGSYTTIIDVPIDTQITDDLVTFIKGVTVTQVDLSTHSSVIFNFIECKFDYTAGTFDCGESNLFNCLDCYIVKGDFRSGTTNYTKLKSYRGIINGGTYDYLTTYNSYIYKIDSSMDVEQTLKTYSTTLGNTVAISGTHTNYANFYENSTSGLTATNTQDAIDEVAAVAPKTRVETVPIEFPEDGGTPPDTAELYSNGVYALRIRKFSGTADNSVTFNFTPPSDMDLTQPIEFRYKMLISEATGPSSENVVFSLAGAAIVPGDSTTGTSVGTVVANQTNLGSASQHTYQCSGWESLTLAGMTNDGLIQLEFSRLASSDANDTYAQKIAISELQLRYTVG